MPQRGSELVQFDDDRLAITDSVGRAKKVAPALSTVLRAFRSSIAVEKRHPSKLDIGVASTARTDREALRALLVWMLFGFVVSLRDARIRTSGRSRTIANQRSRCRLSSAAVKLRPMLLRLSISAWQSRQTGMPFS
jgi:hypothetical protein